MRLPVRTALLQNVKAPQAEYTAVRLPVRTALLQNVIDEAQLLLKCDYQSERHCSKTLIDRIKRLICAITSQNGTAPKH